MVFSPYLRALAWRRPCSFGRWLENIVFAFHPCPPSQLCVFVLVYFIDRFTDEPARID